MFGLDFVSSTCSCMFGLLGHGFETVGLVYQMQWLHFHHPKLLLDLTLRHSASQN